MTSGLRITIAIVALLCAFGFIGTAYSSPEAFPNPNAIYGCGVVCVIIALACLSGPVGAILRRVLAGAVFLAYVAYLIHEVTAPAPALLSGSRAKPSIVNAAAGFLLIGIPAALYAALGNRLIDWFASINKKS